MRTKIINILKTLSAITLAVLVSVSVASAVGTLTPSGTAGDNTQYSLNDIYTRITTGATTTEGSGTMTVPGTVSASFRTLTEIYDALPDWLTLSDTTTTVSAGYYEATTLDAVDADLIASNIKQGATIFGIEGNVIDADTIPTQTLSNSTTTVPYGIYATTTLDAVDADLVAGNIKDGTNIFGVVGSLVSGGGEELEWSTEQGSMNWPTASSTCAGTVDGSTGWRLPTISELLAGISDDWIVEGDNEGDRFVDGTRYWSGTESDPGFARYAYGSGVYHESVAKSDTNSVRCVR